MRDYGVCSLCITGYKELSPVTMPLCEPQRGMFLSVMPLSGNGRRIYAVTFFGWEKQSKRKRDSASWQNLSNYYSQSFAV